MNRVHISTHYSLDDHRLYEFTRNTRLPYGYFDRGWRITPTVAMWSAAIAIGVALLVAACS